MLKYLKTLIHFFTILLFLCNYNSFGLDKNNNKVIVIEADEFSYDSNKNLIIAKVNQKLIQFRVDML